MHIAVHIIIYLLSKYILCKAVSIPSFISIDISNIWYQINQQYAWPIQTYLVYRYSLLSGNFCWSKTLLLDLGIAALVYEI